MEEQIDKETINSLLNNFIYYFIRKIEDKFIFYLDILDEHSESKPTSTLGTAISAATGLIPYVGSGARAAAKEGDTMILKRLDKKNAIAISDIIYYHRDNKEAVRKTIIKTAYELFCCFEKQFLEVSCDGGQVRAMQKLGYDAGNRFINEIIKKESKEITSDLILNSIILNTSNILNTLGIIKLGRTVKDSNDKSWNSGDIYNKIGVYVTETGLCYYKKSSDLNVYGHRLKFEHESIEEIEKNFEKKCEPLYTYDFKTSFKNFEDDFPTILEFIYRQNPVDFAKYDREMKYDEIMKILTKHHMEILEISANQYLNTIEHNEKLHSSIIEKTDKQHEELTNMLSKISDTQETLVQRQENQKVDFKPALDMVNGIVEDKIKHLEGKSVGSKLGKEIREHVKSLNPVQTHEFKRLRDNIRKIKL